MDLYTKNAYQLAELLTKNYSTSFSLSSRLFKRTIRPHIYAIYGMVRIADEIVDTYAGEGSEEKLHALVVWKTTNKGRDYLRKSYVKREVMFDNDVAELQYRTTESAEAALLGLEKQKYLSMAFEGLRRKNLINYMIFMRVVMEGVSTEEVAREFGYTRNNVNNRVLRARKWLLAEILRLEKE
jgi:RNA polymerase sigma-70 factor (ECF subfamily)